MTQINSPCVRNCCLNKLDICLGCFRSLDEIKLWGRSDTSNQQKAEILTNSATRRQKRKKY